MAIGLLSISSAAIAAPAQVSTAFKLKRVAKVVSPTSLTGAKGFPNLIFVAERPGRIRVIKNGHLVKKPFLDIRGRVNDTYLEQGLIGIAFPPDYKKTGRFYVHYTTADNSNVIDEFHRKSTLAAKPGSRREVIKIAPVSTYWNHSGGQMRFRSNNQMYFGVGDGMNPGDIENNGQSLDTLRGKMLRIDPHKQQNGDPYGVPHSNPFYGGGGRPEIFAYGLRNPFTFSFDQRHGKAPTMIIGDVGMHRFEEIDYGTLASIRGANFGWKAFEGYEPYDCAPEVCPYGGLPDPGGTVFPIYAYDHSNGCAVITGGVVRDPTLPSLRGRLIYGDFCTGRLSSLVPHLPVANGDRSLNLKMPNGELGYPALNGFGTDAENRTYVYSENGPVYRLTEPHPNG